MARHPPHRSQRAGFPHGAPVFGGHVEPRPRHGVSEVGHRQPLAFQAEAPCARQTAFLTPPAQGRRPSPHDLRAERGQRRPVQRHPLVPIVAQEDRAPPSALLRYGIVQASPQFRCDGLTLGPPSRRSRLPPHDQSVRRGLATDMCAAQDVQGGRRTRPPPGSSPGGTTPNLPQAGVVGVECQVDRCPSRAQFPLTRRRCGPMCEAQPAVIGVPHDADLSPCVALPPRVCPEGTHLMERAVRAHGAAAPPRRHPFVRLRPPPLGQYARLPPRLEEADHPGIPPPLLDTPEPPRVRHVVENAVDIRVAAPVHAFAMDADPQGIQGVMGTAPWSASGRKPPALCRPETRHDPGGHPLDHCSFPHGHASRSLAAGGLRDRGPPHGRGPVRASCQPCRPGLELGC